MSSVEPGWYAAQGDPPGTQRYWDGNQWVGDPQPVAAAQPVAGDQYGAGGQFGGEANYATGANFGVDSPPASFGSQPNQASQVPQPKSESPIGWFMLYWSRWSDFSGRSRRAEYWWGSLITWLAVVLVLALAAATGSTIFFVLYFLMVLVWIVPSVSAAIRRLHDTGKSGWFMLLGLIPLANFVLLYFYFVDGDSGANRYGMSPKSMFNNR